MLRNSVHGTCNVSTNIYIYHQGNVFGNYFKKRENSKRKRELRRYCRMMQGEKEVETASPGGQEKRQTDRCVAYSQLNPKP